MGGRSFGAIRNHTKARRAIHATVAALLLTAAGARAEEHVAGFANLSESQSTTPLEDWGPVPTHKESIANLAPGLLPFFNNGPVFGLPGTVTGDFWDQTQLTGDWDGVRTEMTRRGLFIDLYSTSAYQDVTSGGLNTGTAFLQNTQLSVNLDTGRTGLWPGGLFHFTVQSRYGASPEQTFTVGSFVPQYYGALLPGPLLSHDTLPSEYYLVQAVTPKVSVVLGKISDLFVPDQTLFGDRFRTSFANFNFNLNPITVNFYNPTALAALGVWTPTKSFAVFGGVLDPYSQPTSFADDAFKRADLYAAAIASYQVQGLPGQFYPQFSWSNLRQIDRGDPFGALSPALVKNAVGALVGALPTAGLPVNYLDSTWFLISNWSQYLFVKDDPAAIEEKRKSGQTLRGIGVFARAGYAPPATTTVTWDASVALFATGLMDSRPYDSFGVGFYDNVVSNNFKNSITQLTQGTSSAADEWGVELFYDFAITPAVRINVSYQHIWNPLVAQVVENQKNASVFLARLNIAYQSGDYAGFSARTVGGASDDLLSPATL
jgi:porin